MKPLSKGRYRVRLAETSREVQAAQALRWKSFVGKRRAAGASFEVQDLDADSYDSICHHVLIEESASARLLSCFRLLPLSGGAQIRRSYSAQFYDLGALEGQSGPMLELGRFCIDPEVQDPDILRLAWAAITQWVDEAGTALLFGCSSFMGTDWRTCADSLATLATRHLAPRHCAPRPGSPRAERYAEALAGHVPDPKRALQQMPPLLRTYLMMGGWVSDHLVVDPDLDTFHVFTGLEIAAIPPARARALRLLAG